MKVEVFKYDRSRVLKKALLSLLCPTIQFGFNIYFFNLVINDISFFLISNLLWGVLFTLPCLWITFNYFRIARQTTIELSYNSLVVKQGNTTVELTNKNINKIIIHSVTEDSKFPWMFYEFYEFQENDKKIVFSNFSLEISDLWQSDLARRISSKKIEKKYSWFPLIN